MSNFKSLKWGDICTLEYGIGIRDYKDFENDFPVYGSSGKVGTYHKFHSKKGVIISRKGTLAVYYSEKPFFVIDTAFWLKPKKDLDPRWAYYALLDFNIKKLRSGTSVPSLSRDDFYSANLLLPKLSVQKTVASFLSKIDKKIELNKKINQTLEEITKTLFKSWFIDFDPVRAKAENISTGLPKKISDLFPNSFEKSELGDIPRGWKIKTLDDLTSKFTTGLNPRKNFILGEGNNFYVTIKNLGENNVILDDKCYKVTDEAIIKINNRSDLKKDDLLFSGIGTIGKVVYIYDEPKNWNISESVFTLRANLNLTTPSILYFILKSDQLQNYAQALASGSVQRGIRMSALKDFKIINPTQEIQKKFQNISDCILRKISNNLDEINNLSNLRDIILPKLISGELKTSDNEKYFIKVVV